MGNFAHLDKVLSEAQKVSPNYNVAKSLFEKLIKPGVMQGFIHPNILKTSWEQLDVYAIEQVFYLVEETISLTKQNSKFCYACGQKPENCMCGDINV